MNEREALVIHTNAIRTGDQVRLTLTVDLPAGVHIEPHRPMDPYLIPTVLEVEDLAEPAVEYPAPTTKDLGWNDLALTVLEGTVTFVVSGRVHDRSERIHGTLSFQPCIGGACLPPRTVRWVSPLSGQTAYSVLGALASRPSAVFA